MWLPIDSWSRRPSFTDVQSEIASARADHAIVAEAYSQGGGIYVRLIDLRTNSPDAGMGVVGPFNDLASAKAGAIAEMERAWKVRSIIRTSGSNDVALIATFRDIGEWVKIRKSLETSRLVRNLNIESLSAGGADLRFAYSGRPDQLAADLRSQGVDLRNGDGGWVLQVVSANEFGGPPPVTAGFPAHRSRTASADRNGALSRRAGGHPQVARLAGKAARAFRRSFLRPHTPRTTVGGGRRRGAGDGRSSGCGRDRRDLAAVGLRARHR